MHESQVEEGKDDDEQKVLNMFKAAQYQILPSFFKTVMSLKKQKRDFAVVLRGEQDLLE